MVNGKRYAWRVSLFPEFVVCASFSCAFHILSEFANNWWHGKSQRHEHFKAEYIAHSTLASSGDGITSTAHTHTNNK